MKHITVNLDLRQWNVWPENHRIYTTIEDHKENFSTNPKCCLINPAESKLWKVKKTLWRLSIKTSEKCYIASSGNTSNVIDWFQNITDKKNYIFVQKNTEEF